MVCLMCYHLDENRGDIYIYINNLFVYAQKVSERIHKKFVTSGGM